MDLLDSILAKKIRLIDYECITESGERNGRRLVAFGKKVRWVTINVKRGTVYSW